MINHLTSKKGTQCPTKAQLSKQLAQTNPFRYRKREESLLRSKTETCKRKKAEVL
jgi:hypothetical protein